MKDFQPSVQLPDENGNYHLYLGYLNGLMKDLLGNTVYNLQHPFQDILNKDGIVMQRLKEVPLYGELINLKNKNNYNQFEINKNNICCKITDLYFDYTLGEKVESPGMVGLMGTVKPFGPKSDLFKNDLDDENKFVNLIFRGYEKFRTDEDGTTIFTLLNLVTFDYHINS